jgi:hypothetical protein
MEMAVADKAVPLTFKIIPRDAGKAFLLVKCHLNPDGECKFPLAPKRILEFVWEWDGNIRTPTIAPSISCRTVGCGKHFTINKGAAA